METVGTLVKGYLAVGALVLVVQTGMIRLAPEPVCRGSVVHVLTDRYFPPTDDTHELYKTTTGEKDIHDTSLMLRVMLHAARWAPDLFQQVVAGDMSLVDYLRGGSRCSANWSVL